ncbi:unnamed protein product [Leptidea sinapis]|uniref:Uncharacterized protein n=1 Tax=Leptidea sinapis TaxID=189913 RepID=A0A5E4QBU1_9NEOP|nr:unnamed protein product [Leptidea sinapis]
MHHLTPSIDFSGHGALSIALFANRLRKRIAVAHNGSALDRENTSLSRYAAGRVCLCLIVACVVKLNIKSGVETYRH